MKKIGIALGAGGARGLAHIIILEAFEELGIKPHIISGSSIGAIVGAAYASGMTTKEMKDSVEELILSKKYKFTEFYKKYDV
ncbi:MAG: patatin-like phospholipase family protein, partial [Melioribacteraceae bacterium]|nr:patatin-like phospholipase family protein [Melioribacteraceae bacterium]